MNIKEEVLIEWLIDAITSNRLGLRTRLIDALGVKLDDKPKSGKWEIYDGCGCGTEIT